MDADQRCTELEIKVAFLDQLVNELASALRQESQANASLAERVTLLERALGVLAARVPRPKDDVANAAEDPVPSSG
jgi:uncharacterized coiled-coil protein SlyX